MTKILKIMSIWLGCHTVNNVERQNTWEMLDILFRKYFFLFFYKKGRNQ